jgi:hypothetical protein
VMPDPVLEALECMVTDDVCDPITGECSNPPVPELTACELEGVLGECIEQMCVGSIANSKALSAPRATRHNI